MVNFTVDQLSKMMKEHRNIRNLSVIAHVDHGKSTLTDSLVCKAGIIAGKKAGLARFTDTRKDEQERGVTIKSTGISLFFDYIPHPLAISLSTGVFSKEMLKMESDAADGDHALETVGAADGEIVMGEVSKNSYLINLIDSPGHVDFSSEVTAALRVTDGALVVVDCIEGVAVQTETVLRQALSERVKPVVMCNKLDRPLLEMHLEPEDTYQNLTRVIQDVNVIASTYAEDAPLDGRPCIGDCTVDPCVGTVAFGSGLHQWGFTLMYFANLYASKFGIESSVMLKNLWGERYYNPTKQKFVNKSVGGLKRGFVHFILDPIFKLCQCVMEEKTRFSKKMGKEVLQCWKMFNQLGIKLSPDDKELRGKALFKKAMQRWLPAAEALMEMMVVHLPSPWHAQKYRTELLYEGPVGDVSSVAMTNCDPDGVLMMYVSKMVPAPDKGRFYAFGRVFSGTIKTGQKCRIMGPNYDVDKNRLKQSDLNIKSVQRTVIMMGNKVSQVTQIPCGNTCGLVGIDNYVIKTATITDADNTDAYNIKQMKFSVSPVVRVAVEPRSAGDLPKLVEGLKRLAKSDPMVVISHSETGEHIIAGAGELHLEICLKDLQEDYMKGTKVNVSPPVVAYREFAQEESDQMCLSKSPNKHNRLFMKAQPLDDEFVQKIDEILGMDKKTRARFIADEFPEEFDKREAEKIWSFAPEGAATNMLRDRTVGVQYLGEIKESVNNGFQWACRSGPLCEEEMRGVMFCLYDVALHADSIHRGMGQVMPPARRVCFASLLTGNPGLLEPYFLCEITCPIDACGGIYSTLSQRRGIIIGEEPRIGTPMNVVKAHVPVAESFGLTGSLRAATGGKAFPQCVFSHYDSCPGGALNDGSFCANLVEEIRERKGLPSEIPDLGRYLDKL